MVWKEWTMDRRKDGSVRFPSWRKQDREGKEGSNRTNCSSSISPSSPLFLLLLSLSFASHCPFLHHTLYIFLPASYSVYLPSHRGHRHWMESWSLTLIVPPYASHTWYPFRSFMCTHDGVAHQVCPSWGSYLVPFFVLVHLLQSFLPLSLWVTWEGKVGSGVGGVSRRRWNKWPWSGSSNQ